MFTIQYFDRGKKKPVELFIHPADIIGISIPKQDGQPALKVDVSTDGVTVRRQAGGTLVAAYEYEEMLADAAEFAADDDDTH